MRAEEVVVEEGVSAEGRRVRVQLIRVHEDGTCARWQVEPGTMRLVLVIPARVRRVPVGVAA